MNTPATRLQQLLAFYADDPTDAFTIYALATEYRAQEPERAWEFYQKLLAEHPDYVGTYYPVSYTHLTLPTIYSV